MIGYPQSSVPIIIRQSLEGGLFKLFAGPEALFDKKLWKTIGAKNLNGMVYTRPVPPAGVGPKTYNAAFKKAHPKAAGQLYTPETYDATFLLALAIQKAGTTDRTKVRDALRMVADGKGTKIYPGQWKKAVALIKAGKAIDYVGASGTVDFDKNGDVTEASYKLFRVVKGKPVDLGYVK